MIDPKRPLRRSSKDKMMAGVCAGIAHWVGWDPTAIRVIYALATAFLFVVPGIVAYIVLALIMPEDPEA